MRVLRRNRVRARTPTRKRFWCDCDRNHIGQSGKCSVCGHTRKGSKDKKPGPQPENS